MTSIRMGAVRMIAIKYLLSRASAGYALMVPILIMYYLLLAKFRKMQKPLHIAAVFLFSFYLFSVITGTGIGGTAPFSFPPIIKWIPFDDIFNAPMHFFLNIVVFAPFGFFLPLLYRRYCNIRAVAITGFLFSLCIELLQMFGWGATEIDDLAANTLGVCLGYFAYRLIKKGLHMGIEKQFQAVDFNDTFELILLAACTFLIMAFVRIQ